MLRTVAAVGNLRKRFAYAAIREATLTVAGREGFRIIHLSIQRRHLHLLVEASDHRALSKGMQSFQISAAKQLNAAIGRACQGARRRGTVFPDRYYAEVITSPRQAHHALRYVLSNWRKHGEAGMPAMDGWSIDWFSSAVMFPGWAEYADRAFLWQWPAAYDPLFVYQPHTWLLREGWKKHGPISCHHGPSASN